MLLEQDLWRVYKTTNMAFFLFVCLPGFFLLDEIEVQPFKLAVRCGSVWPHLEVWLGLKLGRRRCVKDLWDVHQIDTEHSVPHSNFRQGLSRAWKAATDK